VIKLGKLSEVLEMVKKKAKKIVARKKVARGKVASSKKKKKVIKISARTGTRAEAIAEVNRAKAAGEKAVGMIEHYFDKISVAAMKLRAPLKVGDTIHIKGHTTDLIQKLESMQIEHQGITSAKKGEDIGFKVNAKVREHDIVYIAPAAKIAVQTPIFPSMSMAKPLPGGLGNTKFLNF